MCWRRGWPALELASPRPQSPPFPWRGSGRLHGCLGHPGQGKDENFKSFGRVNNLLIKPEYEPEQGVCKRDSKSKDEEVFVLDGNQWQRKLNLKRIIHDLLFISTSILWTQVKCQCFPTRIPVGKGRSPQGTSSRSWWGGRSRWGWRWCREGARQGRAAPGSSKRGWESSWVRRDRKCRTTPCGSCDAGTAFPCIEKHWVARTWILN